MNNNFQYSAIGDNTPENREHLEKLGYTMSMVTMDKSLLLKTQTNGKYYETNKDDWSEAIVNCIGNPALFQAVTAMRTDSDYLQWFTNGAQFLMFDGNDFIEFHIKMNRYHKASLAELQEHFKRNIG